MSNKIVKNEKKYNVTQNKVELLIKSSFWYTVSNFLAKAAGFITTPIFARILSTTEYGNFNVYANWQSMLTIICGLEIYTTLNKARLTYKDEESLNSYIFTCLILNTLNTLIFFVIYIIFAEAIESFLMMNRQFILVIFAYLLTKPAFEMFQMEQRVKYRYKLSATITFVITFLATILAIILTNIMDGNRLFGRILGQYSLYILLGGFFYIGFLTRSRKFSFEKGKYAIKIALPLVFSYLGSSVLMSADKIVTQHLSTAEAVAYIGLGHTCANILIIFVRCLNNAWSPYLYDKLETKEYEDINKKFRMYMLIVVFCTVAILLLGPELVFILGGNKYASTLTMLPAIMLGGIMTLIISQYTAYETYHEKTHYAAYITAAVAIVNVVLDILGVYLFNYLVVVYVTVLCYILMFFFHLKVTTKMGISDVFLIKEQLIAIGILVFLIPLMLILYKYIYIRYFVIGILFFGILFFVVEYKKVIFSKLRRIRGKKCKNED